MALEKPAYRDNLERIKAHYPDKEMLKVKDVQMCIRDRYNIS